MKNILRITNELSKTLQCKELDVVNAMTLVKISKQWLQIIIDDECGSFLNEVTSFFTKHEIIISNMNDKFVARRWHSRAQEITNLHHYCVEKFYNTIDLNCYTEEDTELLLCVTCLNPSGSFSALGRQKLVYPIQFYPVEFSTLDLITLDNRLETYVMDMHSNNESSRVNGLGQEDAEMKRDRFISISLLAHNIGTNLADCYCYCWESIF